MLRIAVLAVCLLAVAVNYAGEARQTFLSIAERLTAIVQNANCDAILTQDATSFRAEYDTMSYTVHPGSKSGDHSPRTRRETGPRTSGFVITLSVTPLEPTAARSGQTMQRPYWREYFWTGHADDSEYIRLVFKFGTRVDEAFKERVIEAVTRGTSGPGSSTALALPPAGDVNPVDEMLDRDEDLRRRFQKIAKGMTEAQVRAIKGGPPHEIIRTARWVYNLSSASDTWTERNRRLVVDFSGGNVERLEESYDCYYIGFTFDE